MDVYIRTYFMIYYVKIKLFSTIFLIIVSYVIFVGIETNSCKKVAKQFEIFGIFELLNS